MSAATNAIHGTLITPITNSAAVTISKSPGAGIADDRKPIAHGASRRRVTKA